MTSQERFVHPPRIAVWLITLFACGEETESVLGDLFEEFSQVAAKSGVAFARSWYRRQARETIAYLIGAALRRAPWLIATFVVGGLVLNRFVSGLPERAIFAVLDRYQVFDHHFSVFVFFSTYGIALGHVVASLFVGCAVALAAKGREMVATMTLGLAFCAMTGVAGILVVSTGHTLTPWMWMLPWNVADWVAIVAGGAIIQTRRAAVRPLHA